MASHMKTNITDTWVKNLKPTAETQEFGDASSPGLRVRITPKGKKTFVYSYSHPVTGMMKRVKIGTYPSTGLKAARDEWSRLSDIRIKDKLDPKEKLDAETRERQAAIAALKEKETPADLITVNKLIQIYTRDTSGRKKSWKEEQRVLQKELGDLYGSTSAYDITRDVIKKIVTDKRLTGKQTQANAIIPMCELCITGQ